MKLFKTPALVRFLLPQLMWKMSNADAVFLTFDDGPIPEVTPFVLDQLKAFGAKATFFCVGDNVRKHPDIYQRILDEGHTVGNHTFSHPNQWKTADDQFLADVDRAAELIDSKLFRPPYGKLTPKMIKQLARTYQIIMWDVLTWDFKPEVSTDTVVRAATERAKLGSIIVLHDNIRTAKKLKEALPKILRYFYSKEIPMEAIPMGQGN